MRQWASAWSALSLALSLGAVGCTIDNPGQLQPTTSSASSGGMGGSGGDGGDGGSAPTGTGGMGGGTGGAPQPTELDARERCYGDALRSASFKLVGNAPTLQQMMDLDNTPDAYKPAKYEQMIDDMLASPDFSRRMVEFWKNQFRMFDAAPALSPSRNTAPVFAARLVVEGKPYTDLLTANANTCPVFDEATATFGDGECNNGTTPAGILTDPGIHALYYGNMAFRRNRFFHETFLCRNANEPVAEPTGTPGMGAPAGVGYASPWPWTSIAGGTSANVNFLSTDGVVCANCHATWNHRAPLFAHFDDKGMYQPDIAVPVPIIGLPLAQLSDFLPPGETTAWKFGMPAATMTELGQVMAKDSEVHACAVARLWNFAMSRGDMVETGVKTSYSVLQPLIDQFVQNNFDQKKLLKSIFVSKDFVEY